MHRHELAVVGSDTHLAKITWQKHPELCGDSFRALEFLVTTAIDRQVPLILLGDIFDKQKPDSETVAFFCGQMDRCAAERTLVYFIQGNHDYALPPWPLVHSWPTWVHRKVVVLDQGIKVYGIDYTPRDQLDAELALIPRDTRVVLMHQAWDEFQGIGATDGSLASVPRGELVLTGDYHVRLTKAIANNSPYDSVSHLCVHSPGSTCMQALNEPHAKFGSLLAFINIGLVIEDIPLPGRAFVDLEVKTPEQLQAALAYLSTAPTVEDKPIVRFRFSDTLENAYDQIVLAAGDRYHLFAEPQHAAVEQVAIQVGDTATSPANFDTLETGLQAMYQQGAIDEATYGAAVRLLRAGIELPNEPQRLFDELRSASAPVLGTESPAATQVLDPVGQA